MSNLTFSILNSSKKNLVNLANLAKIMVLTWLFFPFTSSAQFAGGNGTEFEPYIIETAQQLAQLAAFTNQGNANFNDKYYQLANDIDLSAYQTGAGWNPIGNGSATSFKGYFDGNNKKITGLVINNTGIGYIGLFGYVTDGTVRNIGVVDADIKSSFSISVVGGIVGWLAGGTMLNCYSSGSVSASSPGEIASSAYAGGLVGYTSGSISNCYSTTSVTSFANNSFSAAGGIAGHAASGSSISRCYATGAISASSNAAVNNWSSNAGGIVGDNGSTNILNCAALNSSIYSRSSYMCFFGRVTSRNQCNMSTFTNNVGFIDMENPSGDEIWNNIGATLIDGADIEAATIWEDGSIGGLFLNANGWMIQNGKLPGLAGNTVAIPEHLNIPGPPVIKTESLPNGIAEEAYSEALKAKGVKPITWSLNSGDLPEGLILSEVGVISGTPLEDGIYNFTVKATNEVGDDTKELTITIAPAPIIPPVITTQSLPNSVVGTEYSQTFTATGGVPIIWTLESGILPNGLEILSEGEISGTPITAGTFAFTVKAENGGGEDTKEYLIVIVAADFETGTGTEEDPYIITTREQLVQLAMLINANNEDYNTKHYKLENDIDLSAYNTGEGWTPIGLEMNTRAFRGVFDGNYKEVSGVYINTTTHLNVGLFGFLQTGTVKNLGVVNVNITNHVMGMASVGAVVGNNATNSFVRNCYSSGTLKATSTNSNTNAGGIVGNNSGNVSHCYSMATVTAAGVSSGANGGGIVGNNMMGTIANCYSIGVVSATTTGTAGAGGISGGALMGTISNCVALNPSISGSGNPSSFYGRVIGVNTMGTLAGNIGFNKMRNPNGAAEWEFTEANQRDGEDIDVYAIHEDGTFDGRFLEENGWATENGKLPGFGAPVEMAEHLIPPTITTDDLPFGEVGVAYNQTLTATGYMPITWSLESGTLPGGFTLSTAGLISGMPSAEGTFTFTVKATNYLASDTKEFTVEIETPGFDSGDGSEENPYIIVTPQQLALLAVYINGNNTNYNTKYYKLGNDIDLSGYQDGEGWRPIGLNATFSFKGIFDGNNKEVSGLFINTTTLDNVGLFGHIQAATVKNLGVVNVNITNHVMAMASVGGVVGNNATGGIVRNCYSSGTIKATSTNSNTNAGGIVGNNSANVSNCYSMASINAAGVSSGANGGGIVGNNMMGTISNCYSIGSISSSTTGTANAGGIAGYTLMGSISNSAALNTGLNGSGNASSMFRRVLGGNMMGGLTNNIAFDNILNPNGEAIWETTGANHENGASIDVYEIHEDGTFGDRFIEANGWTTEDGKLPGFGAPVEMPEHLRIPVPPSITTEELPNAEVGAPYSHTLTAEGNEPITWSLEDGALPAGLALSPSGVISGTPTTQGAFNFMVKATNAFGSDTKVLSILVVLIEYPPVIVTLNLPRGYVGATYSQTLTATGTAPITWLVISGSLPAELELSATGTISGTPSAAGISTFTVKAANNAGEATRQLTINIEATGFESGTGSEEDPFIIATAAQLKQLATHINDGNDNFNDKHYKLINDIDLLDYQTGVGWISIGAAFETQFRGNVFDGNYKIITGLYMDNESLDRMGLFGYVGNSTIKNLGVEDVNLTSSTFAYSCIAAVVGYNISGTVSNCYSTGIINSSATNSGAIAGGIVGYNTGFIYNCYSTANINASNTGSLSIAGGVVGINMGGRVSGCYSTGALSAFSLYSSATAGGVIGNNLSFSAGFVFSNAALNPSIACQGNTASHYGRVIGQNSGSISEHIAFNHMINPFGGTSWFNIGAGDIDGANITIEQIHADGTLGGMFTEEDGWTTANGKLPGLFGNFVDMPEHLRFPGAPVIITESLPNGVVGAEYSQMLEAEGYEPITWAIESGDLPTGLTLSEEGEISGIPTAEGTFNFVVKATNNVTSDIKGLSITILLIGDLPVITTENLPGGKVGETYNQTLTAEGTTPITWSLDGGALPTGLELTGAGVISGIPTASGVFNFTVKATNIIGNTTKGFSISVIYPPVITTETLPDGKEGIDYNQTLTANSDTPVTWSLEGGNLPLGLTIYGNGTISGTPMVPGTYTFTVKASNEFGADTKSLTIVIIPIDGILDNVVKQHLTACIRDGILHLSGLIPGEKWSIYDMSGRLIYENMATCEVETHFIGSSSISIATAGIYIIKSGNKTVKVVF